MVQPVRFIAKIATLPIRRHIEEWDDRAQQSRIVQQGIMAIFENGMITDYELEQGYKHLGPFKGLPTYEDEVTVVEPRKLIRVYDTGQRAKSEKWTDAEHQMVIDYLMNHELYGTDFVAVDTPRRPAPWPAYDKLDGKTKADMAKLVDRIVAKVIEDEYDPAEVLAYERENLNREPIVAALEQLAPASAAPVDIDELVLDA